MSDATTPTTSFVPGPPPPPPGKNIFSTKVPSVTTFAVAILLFLLPFIDVKCNGMSLKKLSGVELATGYDIKMGPDNSLGGKLESFGKTDNVKTSEKKDVNPYALAALVIGAAGLLFSIIRSKTGGTMGFVSGILGAAALIALYIDINRKVKAELSMPTTGGSTDDMGLGKTMSDVAIKVEFSAGFYLALFAFVAAAYFSYRRMKVK